MAWGIASGDLAWTMICSMLSVRTPCRLPGNRSASDRPGGACSESLSAAGTPEPLRAAETILDGGPGREEDVVLVGAQEVAALLAEHADDREGHVLDADLLADGVAAAEQLADQRLADQADLFAAEQFALVEDPPQLQVGPVAHLEEIGRAPRHAGGSNCGCRRPPGPRR